MSHIRALTNKQRRSPNELVTILLAVLLLDYLSAIVALSSPCLEHSVITDEFQLALSQVHQGSWFPPPHKLPHNAKRSATMVNVTISTITTRIAIGTVATAVHVGVKTRYVYFS